MDPVASRIDKAALKALSQPSDRRGLLQLGGHLALLGLTGTAVLSATNSLWLGPALLAHGIVLSFLFAPLHECIHRTAFASRRLNDAVAAVSGALLLLPPGYFRAFHLSHHRFTQDPARDPELAGPALRHRRGYLVRISGLPYWREQLAVILRHAGGRVAEPFLPARQHPAIIREARLYLAAYGLLAGLSLAAGSTLLLWLWLIPALLGQPFLRLYLLAEHWDCPRVPDMLANSRTTATNRAVAFLCWNMNRHTAHHAFPAIPFHALPAADRLLAKQIERRSPGYARLQFEIWRGLARA